MPWRLTDAQVNLLEALADKGAVLRTWYRKGHFRSGVRKQGEQTSAPHPIKKTVYLLWDRRLIRRIPPDPNDEADQYAITEDGREMLENALLAERRRFKIVYQAPPEVVREAEAAGAIGLDVTIIPNAPASDPPPAPAPVPAMFKYRFGDQRIHVEEVAYHRNGSGGAGFYVVAFRWDGRPMVGILFPDFPAHLVSVFNRDMLGQGIISNDRNAWRGDQFETALWDAVERDRAGRRAEAEAEWKEHGYRDPVSGHVYCWAPGEREATYE